MTPSISALLILSITLALIDGYELWSRSWLRLATKRADPVQRIRPQLEV